MMTAPTATVGHSTEVARPLNVVSLRVSVVSLRGSGAAVVDMLPGYEW
jgi:hypothetical protein